MGRPVRHSAFGGCGLGNTQVWKQPLPARAPDPSHGYLRKSQARARTGNRRHPWVSSPTLGVEVVAQLPDPELGSSTCTSHPRLHKVTSRNSVFLCVAFWKRKVISQLPGLSASPAAGQAPEAPTCDIRLSSHHTRLRASICFLGLAQALLRVSPSSMPFSLRPQTPISFPPTGVHRSGCRRELEGRPPGIWLALGVRVS